jgi:hypothetical protein
LKLPISTLHLNDKDFKMFWNDVLDAEKKPVGLTPTPKLERLRKLLKEDKNGKI